MNMKREALVWSIAIAAAIALGLLVAWIAIAIAFRRPNFAPLYYVAAPYSQDDYSIENSIRLNPLDSSLEQDLTLQTPTVATPKPTADLYKTPEPTLDPIDTLEPTLVPIDTLEPTLVPIDTLEPTLIPIDTLEPIVTPISTPNGNGNGNSGGKENDKGNDKGNGGDNGKGKGRGSGKK